MISDIEKAFLQVGLQEKERDVTRFLWLRDPTKPVSESNLIEYRFRRVAFGVISSPFLLAATVKHHLCQQNSKSAEDIASNIYVDNVLAGRNTQAEAIDFYRESKALFNEISMNIREWYTNSKPLQEVFDVKDKGKDTIPKVLGVKWNLETDELSCPSHKLVDCEVTTKRQLVKAASTIFDPCGWFSPVTIRAKMIVQDIWKEKWNWDAKLPEMFVKTFQEVLGDLSCIDKVSVPRLLTIGVTNASAEHEVHCFCDASAKAYASVVYIRSIEPNGKIAIRLIISKVRLTPINPITMPRLELMAVTIGTRISNFVINQIESEFKENRDFSYRYVPTTCNPADLPSRGMSLDELKSSERWWTGPSFLLLAEQCWPENTLSEAHNNYQESSEFVAQSKPVINPLGVGKIMDVARYATLRRILRVTAWVMKFTQRCRKMKTDVDNLTKRDLEHAEKLWVQYIQSVEFPDGLSSKPGKVCQLGLFIDDQGLIRCKGRFEYSSLPFNAKQPKLLPKDNPFTKLIIQDAHERVCHSGPNQSLSKLRENYWLPSGLSQVKKVLRDCRVCRKYEGGPFKLPRPPPLPCFRVTRSEPFKFTGVDYFGPLMIKEDAGDQTLKKVWICLFTCATVRAIHLEVALDMSTEHFLLCLRRFAAIYGKPSVIISDNAKTFKSADSLFKRNCSSSSVQSFRANDGIEWHFIPELAPWMGGFYERLVGSVKRALRKVLGSRCLSLIQLQTVVAEISATVNSRPLIPIQGEPGEIILTPSHFLAKYGKVEMPQFQANSDDPSVSLNPNPQDKLAESWLKGQRLLEAFWKVWVNDYLTHLRERYKGLWPNRNSSDLAVKPGTVVLIKENLPRCRWKMGRVQELHFGNDGQCRHVTVLLPSNKKIVRPIKLLYPLEESQFTDVETSVKSNPTPLKESKVQRKSALKAMDKRKRWNANSSLDNSDCE